mmetsp:Transcript_36249/g.53085  ORF Transcript_36249/g.53085 Transcript_36249/m.53085 type:complete len:253 (-) Transcript_36249:75-833(-)
MGGKIPRKEARFFNGTRFFGGGFDGGVMTESVVMLLVEGFGRKEFGHVLFCSVKFFSGEKVDGTTLSLGASQREDIDWVVVSGAIAAESAECGFSRGLVYIMNGVLAVVVRVGVVCLGGSDCVDGLFKICGGVAVCVCFIGGVDEDGVGGLIVRGGDSDTVFIVVVALAVVVFSVSDKDVVVVVMVVTLVFDMGLSSLGGGTCLLFVSEISFGTFGFVNVFSQVTFGRIPSLACFSSVSFKAVTLYFKLDTA